jgi:hypothetical protein
MKVRAVLCRARVQDMYDVLRPGLVRFASYPEACAAVSDILAKEAAASASGLEPIDEDDDDDSEDEVGSKVWGGMYAAGSGQGEGGGGDHRCCSAASAERA